MSHFFKVYADKHECDRIPIVLVTAFTVVNLSTNILMLLPI
ncbi:hypothetical protein [Nostoc sp. UHCC 0251]|nr:hypothetical protein [Nostoc sp. UHCC 0251]MEA5622162.1 hypothetical protein [Nostoc sp. UHCC 0251]